MDKATGRTSATDAPGNRYIHHIASSTHGRVVVFSIVTGLCALAVFGVYAVSYKADDICVSLMASYGLASGANLSEELTTSLFRLVTAHTVHSFESWFPPTKLYGFISYNDAMNTYFLACTG
jgi:hypothetical protein